MTPTNRGGVEIVRTGSSWQQAFSYLRLPAYDTFRTVSQQRIALKCRDEAGSEAGKGIAPRPVTGHPNEQMSSCDAVQRIKSLAVRDLTSIRCIARSHPLALVRAGERSGKNPSAADARFGTTGFGSGIGACRSPAPPRTLRFPDRPRRFFGPRSLPNKAAYGR